MFRDVSSGFAGGATKYLRGERRGEMERALKCQCTSANRLQVALYREIVYLTEQGVLDVAGSDAAVWWGPGLRWGLMS